jgi:predicted NAD/FAD-binding protein
VALHSDPALIPSRRNAWASWNYRVENDGGGEPVSTFTYYMNPLQGVSKKRDYFVTVNDHGKIDPAKIHRRFDYHHPLFDYDAIRSQPELHELNRDGRIFFAGAYFNYGFHEDALRSGLEVSRTIMGQELRSSPPESVWTA